MDGAFAKEWLEFKLVGSKLHSVICYYSAYLIFSKIITLSFSGNSTNQCSKRPSILHQHDAALKDVQQRSERPHHNCIALRQQAVGPGNQKNFLKRSYALA